MDLGLKDKIFVVTGAANGIGSYIYTGLLKEDAIPVGIDIENMKTSELNKLIKSEDIKKGNIQRAKFYQKDIRNEKDMEKIFQGIEKLDGLVNNAALLGGDLSHGGRTSESWDKIIGNNAKPAYILTELAINKFKDEGSIVNMGSIETIMAPPESVLYTTAKAALWGLTIAYSTTLAERNIRSNMISPGNVDTERNKAQYENNMGVYLGFKNKTPLKRSVQPEEVADLVLFLLSEKSKGITGQNYIIDCGYIRSSWDPAWSKKDLKEVYRKK